MPYDTMALTPAPFSVHFFLNGLGHKRAKSEPSTLLALRLYHNWKG